MRDPPGQKIKGGCCASQTIVHGKHTGLTDCSQPRVYVDAKRMAATYPLTTGRPVSVQAAIPSFPADPFLKPRPIKLNSFAKPSAVC